MATDDWGNWDKVNVADQPAPAPAEGWGENWESGATAVAPAPADAPKKQDEKTDDVAHKESKSDAQSESWGETGGQAGAAAPAPTAAPTGVGDYSARLAAAKEADAKLGTLSETAVRNTLGEWSRRLRLHRDAFKKQAMALDKWEEARRRATEQLTEAARRHAELRREAQGLTGQLTRVKSAQSEVMKALDAVEQRLRKRGANLSDDGGSPSNQGGRSEGGVVEDATNRRRYVQRLRAADRRTGELAAAVRALARRARAERAAAERAAGGGGGLQSVRRALQSHVQRLQAVERARGGLSTRLARVEAALGAQEGAAGRGLAVGGR